MSDTYVVRNVPQRICVDQMYRDVLKDITFKRITRENFKTFFPTNHQMGSGFIIAISKVTGKITVRGGINLRAVTAQMMHGDFGTRVNKITREEIDADFELYIVSDRLGDIVIYPNVSTIKEQIKACIGCV